MSVINLFIFPSFLLLFFLLLLFFVAELQVTVEKKNLKRFGLPVF